MKEYEVECFYCDAKITQIIEGGCATQKDAITDALLKKGEKTDEKIEFIFDKHNLAATGHLGPLPLLFRMLWR